MHCLFFKGVLEGIRHPIGTADPVGFISCRYRPKHGDPIRLIFLVFGTIFGVKKLGFGTTNLVWVSQTWFWCHKLGFGVTKLGFGVKYLILVSQT